MADVSEPTVASLLAPFAGQISVAVKKKLAQSPLDDVEQILKNTNGTLFKCAKLAKDPRELEGAFRELIEASNEVRSMRSGWEKTLADISRIYSTQTDEPQPLGELFAETSKQSVRIPADKHEFWRKYQAALSGGGKDDEDIEVVANEEGEDAEPDARFLCPISKTVMKNPMKHELCGHHYEQKNIEQLLKQQGAGQAKCMVRGCKVKIDPKKLVLDDGLQFDIEEWQKAETRKRKKATIRQSEPSGDAKQSTKKKKRMVADDDDDVEDS